MKNPAPVDAKSYKFEKINEFIDYLRVNKFDDRSVLEQKLKELQELASDNASKGLTEELGHIKKELDEDPWNQIEKHKDLIGFVIGEELVARKFYESGSYSTGCSMILWSKRE
ncbi:MAG: hypothetical protein IPP06_02770 [Saprospiraceae bacterium]|nr:hypothetical protein [Candidatus Vicinibacter affinis]